MIVHFLIDDNDDEIKGNFMRSNYSTCSRTVNRNGTHSTICMENGSTSNFWAATDAAGNQSTMNV